VATARESSPDRPRDSCFLFCGSAAWKNLATGLTLKGMQVAETPDKQTQGDKQPEAAEQGALSRIPAVVVSLSALAVIGAATANSLPKFSLPDFALPNFALPNVSLPDLSLPHLSLPNFPRFALPNFDRFVAKSPHQTASAPTPEAVVSARLKDIQLSQQQNAAVLVSLAQSSATQQADLKRISRQLASLSAQTEALQNAMGPLTTSSISIPHSNPRARLVRASRKTVAPLPKPVGPVSVRGAPLSPAPAPGTGV